MGKKPKMLCKNPTMKSLKAFKPQGDFGGKWLSHKSNSIYSERRKKYGVKWSNPDILLNGKLADIKTVSTSIKSRLKSVKEQKLKNAVLFIPDNFTLSVDLFNF